MKRHPRRLLGQVITAVSMICAASLLFTSLAFGQGPAFVPGPAFAPGPAPARVSDLDGHWAAALVSDWLDQGLVTGYEDGSFRPDRSVSRAEFFALVNRAFGYQDAGSVTFTDVPPDAWYAAEVARAANVGYVAGYQDGTMRPSHAITRQEVAVVLSRILRLATGDTAGAARFGDAASIAAWSQRAVSAVAEAGYVTGYADGTFRAASPITRAETVTMLHRIVGELYNQAGTYGSAAARTVLAGNVTISAADVVLRNVVIDGNLYITEGVGQGDVTLWDVTVKGTSLIKGGGANSIIIRNTTLGDTVIDKNDGQVRLVALGNSKIGLVIANSGAKLEEDGVTGAGFGDVTIIELPADAVVEFNGNFSSVSVEAKASVKVTGGSIGDLSVGAGAGGAAVDVAGGAHVRTLTAGAAATVSGAGTIAKAVVQAPDVTIAQTPATIEVVEGVKASVGGKVVDSTTAAAAPATPTPGGGSTRIPVRAIRVEPSTLTLTEGTTGTLSATFTPSNASNKNVTWTSSNDGVATVSAAGVVTAVAQGTTTITATLVDGSKTDFATVTVRLPEVVSTYKFDYELPDEISEHEEAEVAVTLATDLEGNTGHEHVRFQFSATGPDGANVTFKATDTSAVEHTFTNSGVWGPTGGFALPADYTATTNWKLTFDQAGQYMITFSLVDLDDSKAVLASGSETVTVKASDTSTIRVRQGQDHIVMNIDRDAKALTAVVGATVGELKGALESTDGSIQAYKVTGKTDGDALVDGDELVVTAADGQTSAAYTITVSLLGAGTELDPYLVGTAQQLDLVRDDLSAFYKQVAEIDLAVYLSAAGAGYNEGKGWVPIGTSDNLFTGVFDGDGYAIKNLTIKANGLFGAGLFGNVGNNGQIVHAHLLDAKVDVTNGQQVGALVGNNKGKVSYSSATGQVKGGTYVGGLVGYNQSTGLGIIENSYARVAVTGGLYVGALLGMTQSNTVIQYAYATDYTPDGYPINSLIGSDSGANVSNSIYIPEPTAEMVKQETFADWDFDTVWNILEGVSYPFLRSERYTEVHKAGLTAALIAEIGYDYDEPEYELTEGDYTPDSWQSFTSAINEAIAVEADAATSQAKVTAALAKLSAAKMALVAK